jgi:photosystem II stability/assembly factor-like uncharacterized protein
MTGFCAVFRRSIQEGTTMRGKLISTILFLFALPLMAQERSAIYVGTSRGLFWSKDGGNSWPRSTVLGDIAVHAVGINSTSPSALFAATPEGIFRSLDSGQNWDRAEVPDAAQVRAIVADPAAPERVYAAGKKLLVSSDAGQQWSEVESLPYTTFDVAIDPTAPTTLFTATSAGVYKSVDAGTSWNRLAGSPERCSRVAVHPQDRLTLYAGTDAGKIWRTRDGGEAWENLGPGDPEFLAQAAGLTWWGDFFVEVSIKAVRALTFDPRDPTAVYSLIGLNFIVPDAGDGAAQVKYEGGRWVALGAPMISEAIAIDPSAPDTIYQGGYGGPRNMYRSRDGGRIWNAIQGFDNLDVLAIAISPAQPAGQTSINLTVPAGGSAAASTLGSDSEARAGYAALTVNSGDAPYGTAVFSLIQNNVTISEAAVAASPATTAARVFVDYRSRATTAAGRLDAGPVDIATGVAAVNPGLLTANVIFTLRDASGSVLASGQSTLPARSQFAKLIHQLQDVATDFTLPDRFDSETGFGSLDITTDQPLSIVGLRLTVNQRSETVLTTMPIADLTRAPSSDPLYFPQLVDGGGYATSIILLNTTDATQTGKLSLFADDGSPVAVNGLGGTHDSTFSYAIPPAGAIIFQTDGFPASTTEGSVQVIPDPGTSTPAGSGIFAFSRDGTLVTESGLSTTTLITRARIYVDESDGHSTGLALASPGQSASITVQAFHSDGTLPEGIGPQTITLSANGHTARLMTQMIPGLPSGFTGVLDISATTPVAALTLRSLINSRGDFLLTTFPTADLTRPAPAQLVFPQLVDGGGYRTQFFLLSTGNESAVTLNLRSDGGTPLAVGK